jgi:hypothetical protein
MSLEGIVKKIEAITPRIFHLYFDELEPMGRIFIRIQEHYENPKFMGQIFEVDEVEHWFATETPDGKKGKTYYESCGGFNFPSSVLAPFYDGTFQKITPEEEAVLEHFRELYDSGEPFYVFATFNRENWKKLEGDAEDANKEDSIHEIAHGLFTTDPLYREKVLKVVLEDPELIAAYKEQNDDLHVIQKLRDTFPAMTLFFDDKNIYHPALWVDETHAYLACWDPSVRKSYVIGHEAHQEEIGQLRTLFKEHLGPLRPELVEYLLPET